ncbi:response regulator [Leeia sp. TBRC 13508]|uniref:Response regulator n=1 Tax=Leeia speluncae TaxID=2884804 RepID=A0ABS8D731_9NEIS|nr:response regulator [Leeia speluncae]MCB6183998.1 response regulator [Leeia speluncae]
MSESTTILVVDDSKVSRMLSTTLIRTLRPGVSIIEAADANQALAAVDANAITLAILDMNMPGITGLELAAILREKHPNVKLAMLTANVQDSVRETANSLKVSFFRKPINETVISTILTTSGL